MLGGRSGKYHKPMMRSAILAGACTLMLAGCHSASWRFDSPSGGQAARATPIPQGSSQSVSISAGGESILGVLLLGAVLADGVRTYRYGPGSPLEPHWKAPDPDPTRRISEQDCTRPIRADGGNLMCK